MVSFSLVVLRQGRRRWRRHAIRSYPSTPENEGRCRPLPRPFCKTKKKQTKKKQTIPLGKKIYL